ncbi:MAG: hypothetical protein NTZ16_09255 [Verrucomicrobia bacterium]|nr:hypothetical protein [Verrucomicrobiota bacterium]
MKASLGTRFMIAAVLITGGFLLQLSGLSGGGILMSMIVLFVTPRSEFIRPLPQREIWSTFGLLAAFVAVCVAWKHLVSGSASEAIERFFRHPAVVVPLWLIMLWLLYRCWRRQKKDAEAKHTAS